MPQIPSYDQRIQPLDGASAVISNPGVKTWEVKNDLISGWVGINESWAYASATTITIPTGGANRYQKGDKVRLKQAGGYKYYYIVTVADTLLTVSGGTDYTVANAAITDIYISRQVEPFGFPTEFNFNPSITNLTVGSGTLIAKFSYNDGMVHGHIDFTLGAGSAIGGDATMTLPVAITTYSVGAAIRHAIGLVGIFDSGTATFSGVLAQIGSATTAAVRILDVSGTYPTQQQISAGVPMIWASGDSFSIDFTYAP